MQITHLLLITLMPVVSSEVTTFDKAVEQCQANGFASVEQLQSTSAGGESYWLPYVRVILPAWEWLNGQPFNGQITSPGVRPAWQECGLIRADHGHNFYDSTSCFDVRFGCKAICQGPCPDTNNCISIEEKSINIARDFNFWFNATNYCNQTKLASLHNKNLDEFVGLLKSKGVKGSKYCVGLRLSKWAYYNNHSKEPANYQWTENVSRDASIYNCSVIQHGHWRPVRCNERHRVLCGKAYTLPPGVSTAYGTLLPVTTNFIDTEKGNSTADAAFRKTLKPGVIAGIVIGVISVAAFFAAIVVLYRRYPGVRDCVEKNWRRVPTRDPDPGTTHFQDLHNS